MSSMALISIAPNEKFVIGVKLTAITWNGVGSGGAQAPQRTLPLRLDTGEAFRQCTTCELAHMSCTAISCSRLSVTKQPIFDAAISSASSSTSRIDRP